MCDSAGNKAIIGLSTNFLLVSGTRFVMARIVADSGPKILETTNKSIFSAKETPTREKNAYEILLIKLEKLLFENRCFIDYL